MEQSQVKLTVYGATQTCPSCVGAPGSIDTYEWLQAAISRKYPEAAIEYEYIDLFEPPANEAHQAFAKKVLEEDIFYPVVLVNRTIVGEGNPRLKTIYHALEMEGIR
ncbi:YuzD family protein [Radiobacillus sp. PE A8.2]|uniref:YuzD family protein n=1 Tax=Radiobacillus sp. PE A8.2 TaxID=3380349 RepID=UPI00388D6767